MRWEAVVSVLLLLAFWATSLWTFAEVRDGSPYWYWEDLLRTLPWFVFCPVFAISALRHPRSTRAGKFVAKLVLFLLLFSPQSWRVLDFFLKLTI